MHSTLAIRPATPADAASAALLLYSAYTHTHIPAADQPPAERGFIDHLVDYFAQDGNRFSYQQTQIAAVDGEIAGLVLAFAGRDEQRLNAAVGPWLRQEAQADEWYVDALAVFDRWGRRGIGTALLRAAEGDARAHNYSRIALYVATENTDAIRFYTRLSYQTAGKAVLYGGPHLRMVKILV